MKLYLKTLASLTLLFVVFSAVAQKKTYFDKSWKKTKETNAKYYRVITPQGSLFLVEDFFKETDKPQMVGTYTTKKLEGTDRTGKFTYYYDNGQKSSEGEFIKGKNDGKWTFWFKNGQMKSEGLFENGERQGPWVFYHKNGQVKSKANFIDGSKDGLSIFYFDDGKTDEEFNFLKGKKHGEYKEYYKNGKIIEQGAYEKDSLTGDYVRYWENGNMSAQGKFNDNKKEGTWTWYHNNGKKSCEAEYKKGRFIKADFYDEGGDKVNKKVYEDDLIKYHEFKGGPNAMLEIINKQIGKRVDFDAAKKEKLVFLAYVKLTLDEEGNVKERTWEIPDADDEDFQDEWGLVRILNSAIDVFPRFVPKKAFNRNVESTFNIIYKITFEKKVGSSLNTW
ncbi:MAG: toxin-antitoxin system YwqK family antitoxin [Bacteroidota bacterium]|nr:toxin-antitoxin system YwqK family antitoxin [Bacteroidota bacterium]